MTPRDRAGEGFPDGAIDLSDLLALRADFLRRDERATPPGRERVTLRLDADVLDWFRAGGKGYQKRMEAVLRAFMEMRE